MNVLLKTFGLEVAELANIDKMRFLSCLVESYIGVSGLEKEKKK